VGKLPDVSSLVFRAVFLSTGWFALWENRVDILMV